MLNEFNNLKHLLICGANKIESVTWKRNENYLINWSTYIHHPNIYLFREAHVSPPALVCWVFVTSLELRRNKGHRSCKVSVKKWHSSSLQTLMNGHRFFFKFLFPTPQLYENKTWPQCVLVFLLLEENII